MSIEQDPMLEHIETTDGIQASRHLVCSIPLEHRVQTQLAWRRIVEEPRHEEEFMSDNLLALDFFRSAGLLTPAYTAAIDTYDDGYESCVLHVAHIEGQSFDELDLNAPQVRQDYQELGHMLLNYFKKCHTHNARFLTDIARVDQFIYGKLPTMVRPKPILVDLELHTDHRDVAYQLGMFEERFIGPMEIATSQQESLLREELSSLRGTLALGME